MKVSMLTTGPAQLLIASTWQGLLMTGCVWVALRAAASLGLHLRASTRFALWLIVFLLVALLPGLSVLHPSAVLAPAGASSQITLHLSPYWAFALEGLWAATSLLCWSRLVAGAYQMRRLWKQSTPVAPQDINPELREILDHAGSRSLQIRLCGTLDSPSAVGFFRPAILIPRALWSDLNPAEMRQILVHERAHIRRGDGWSNLLQKLLRAAFPLNPALLWAERELCRERERACDDAVLSTAGDARSYALCLARLAENRLVRHAAALAPGLWKHASELEERVHDILHRRRMLSPTFSRGLIAVWLVACSVAAVGLGHCPRVISFAKPAALTLANHDLENAPVMLPVHVPSAPAAARYHEAVFHPSPASTTTIATTAVKRVKARRPRAAVVPSLHLIRLQQAQPDGSVFTLVVFTVDMPRGVTLSALPMLPLADFALSNSWITIQI